MSSGFIDCRKIKTIKYIDGVKTNLRQLMVSVTRITKTIGQYKEYDDKESLVVVTELRKVRLKFVNQIKEHFGIAWKIKGNRSFFYCKK